MLCLCRSFDLDLSVTQVTHTMTMLTACVHSRKMNLWRWRNMTWVWPCRSAWPWRGAYRPLTSTGFFNHYGVMKRNPLMKLPLVATRLFVSLTCHLFFDMQWWVWVEPTKTEALRVWVDLDVAKIRTFWSYAHSRAALQQTRLQKW